MNTIKLCLLLFLILLTYPIVAKNNDPILMRINDTPVTLSEFEYAYKKSTGDASQKRQSLNEFLQSYIDLKLSVEEAKKQNIDKQPTFIEEYSKYLEQLQEPYLIDNISPEIVARELYERLKKNVEISWIFIALPKGDILPKDTLDAYKKIVSIRESALKDNTKTFDNLVEQYSEDTVSKKTRIPGYHIWKTTFSEPYSFENAMYATPVNSISNPIRTNEGYYILKVLDRKPDPGQINVAHILVRYPRENSTKVEKDSVKNLANTIYKDLLGGKNFSQLSDKYSVDRAAAKLGGNLGWFGVHRPLPPTFDNLLFGIKEVGSITQPIETQYGYHIFKLLNKLPLSSWEEMKANIIKAIEKSDRQELLTEKKIELLAKKYNYKLDKSTYSNLEEVANKFSLTDTIFINKIAAMKQQRLLFVDNQEYNVGDFIYYLDRNPSVEYNLSTDVLYSKTKAFILDRLINAQKTDLFREQPQFAHLMQEFHDGILYFDIMNKEVWEKSQSDRNSLETIFSDNQNKYVWNNPKFKGYVIHARNPDLINKIRSIINKNKYSANLQQILIDNLNTDSTSNILIEKGLWAKGENGFVDRSIFKINSDNEIIGYPEFITEGKLIDSPETLDDVYGQVVADYQSQLEKEWLIKLRRTYKIEIDEKVLESIKE